MALHGEIAAPHRAHDLVNFIAPWLQVDEEVKQKLIEPESALDRLTQLAETLDDLLNRTREQVEEHRRLKYKAIGSGN